jgi:hypothetical protein
MFEGRHATILIDSGALHNFVSSRIMNLEISKSVTYKQEKVEVEYANGSKMNQCSIQTAKVNIEDYYHSDDFIVATIDKHDVILGRE